MTRRQQVIYLLNTLEDVMPAPETWTGRLVRSSAKRGPAPSRWVDCNACDNGVVLDRFKRPSPCSECSGRGRVHVDDYTNERVGSMESGLFLRLDTVRCDRCDGQGVWKFKRCELCEGTGRRSVTRDELATSRTQRSVFDDAPIREPWWTLLRLLDELKDIAPRTRRHLWRLYVDQRSGALSPGERWAVGQALDWLADHMPAEIDMPGWVVSAARAERAAGPRGRWANGHALKERDAEIRKLARQGRAQQWIAQRFGLTPARVCQVLKSL